jgi:hypothetical protein
MKRTFCDILNEAMISRSLSRRATPAGRQFVLRSDPGRLLPLGLFGAPRNLPAIQVPPDGREEFTLWVLHEASHRMQVDRSYRH